MGISTFSAPVTSTLIYEWAASCQNVPETRNKRRTSRQGFRKLPYTITNEQTYIYNWRKKTATVTSEYKSELNNPKCHRDSNETRNPPCVYDCRTTHLTV